MVTNVMRTTSKRYLELQAGAKRGRPDLAGKSGEASLKKCPLN